eukprot:7385508-Lingulodinium_polyedra.AAC.1
MAAPAATSWPSTHRAPPSKVMSVGVSAPKVPKLPEAPRGTVTSAPARSSRRGISMRLCPRQSGQRRQRQSQVASASSTSRGGGRQ